MFEMKDKLSPVEVVYLVTTKDGTEYDVLIEISHSADCGFWYASMFYFPDSLELIKKSTLSTEKLCELAAITERIFERHMDRYQDDIEYHMDTRAS
jgi:hypothetical protein